MALSATFKDIAERYNNDVDLNEAKIFLELYAIDWKASVEDGS